MSTESPGFPIHIRKSIEVVAGVGTSHLVVAGEVSFLQEEEGEALPPEAVEETHCPCVEEPCRQIPSLEGNSVEGPEREEGRTKTCSTKDLVEGRERERKVQAEEVREPVGFAMVQLISIQC